jgi:pyruvate dehydrogenase E1 component
MPDFSRFPTVSMGLAPINAIYQARFMRYLEKRGLILPAPRKIWAFVGDGEMDGPNQEASRPAGTRVAREMLSLLQKRSLPFRRVAWEGGAAPLQSSSLVPGLLS